MAVHVSMGEDVWGIVDKLSHMCNTVMDEQIRKVTELQKDLARYKEEVSLLLRQTRESSVVPAVRAASLARHKEEISLLNVQTGEAPTGSAANSAKYKEEMSLLNGQTGEAPTGSASLAKYKEEVSLLNGQTGEASVDESKLAPVEEEVIVHEFAKCDTKRGSTPDEDMVPSMTGERQPWISEPETDIECFIEEEESAECSDMSEGEMDKTMTFLEGDEDKGRHLVFLFGSSSSVLMRSIFFAWKKHMLLLMSGEVQDDTEVERTRDAAFSVWPMPADLPDLQRNTVAEIPSNDDSIYRSSTTSGGGGRRSSGHEVLQHTSSHCVRKFISRPDSRKRLFWDSLGFVMIVYDAVIIPVLAAFDLQRTTALNCIWYTSTGFWTADLISNFFVAFYVEGVFEMRFQRIAMRYLQNWFVLDLLLVLLDWGFIILFIVDGDSQSKVLYNFRLVRQVRTIRLFRLLRLARVFPKIMAAADGIRSDTMRLMMSLVMSVAIIIFICHFVACAWYAIGHYNVISTETWVKRLVEHPKATVFNTEFAYRYLISLHWAFCQFTPASMEVHPQNTPERGFAVCVIVLGMVSFSSFVSSITATMTQLRTLNVEKYKRDATLRRYFDQSHLSTEMVKGITDWVRAFNERSVKNYRLHENEIPQLAFLPDRLRKHMHQEVFLSIWNVHPFCKAAKDLDPNTSAKLCHRAIHEEREVEGRELFRKDVRGTKMFFVRCGTLLYSFGGCEVEVGHREWACEPALWVQWYHTGTMLVERSSELMVIDSEEFQKIIQVAWVAMRRFVCAYAALFVRHDCEFTIAGNSWLTDLCWCSQRVHACHCHSAMIYNNLCTSRGATGTAGLKLWGEDIKPSISPQSLSKFKGRTRSRLSLEARIKKKEDQMSEVEILEWV